eukprot:650119-Hanusia_phi.AAC.1
MDQNDELERICFSPRCVHGCERKFEQKFDALAMMSPTPVIACLLPCRSHLVHSLVPHQRSSLLQQLRGLQVLQVKPNGPATGAELGGQGQVHRKRLLLLLQRQDRKVQHVTSPARLALWERLMHGDLIPDSCSEPEDLEGEQPEASQGGHARTGQHPQLCQVTGRAHEGREEAGAYRNPRLPCGDRTQDLVLQQPPSVRVGRAPVDELRTRVYGEEAIGEDRVLEQVRDVDQEAAREDDEGVAQARRLEADARLVPPPVHVAIVVDASSMLALPRAPVDHEVGLVTEHVARLVHVTRLHPSVVARRRMKHAVLRPAIREGPHAAPHARYVHAALSELLLDRRDGHRARHDLHGIVEQLNVGDGWPGAGALEAGDHEQVVGPQLAGLVGLSDVGRDVVRADHVDVRVDEEVALGDGAGDLAQHVDGEDEDPERRLLVRTDGEHHHLERLVAHRKPGAQRADHEPTDILLVLQIPRVEGNCHVLLPVRRHVHKDCGSIHRRGSGHGDSEGMGWRGVRAHSTSEGRVGVRDASLEERPVGGGPEVRDLAGSERRHLLRGQGHDCLVRLLPREIVEKGRADQEVARVERGNAVLQWLLVAQAEVPVLVEDDLQVILDDDLNLRFVPATFL